MQPRKIIFHITILFILCIPQTSHGIGKKEFFERLQEAWNNIRTFQSDVVQESRYSDGVVQRYKGKLFLGEDGRIAYDCNLVGEYKDSSLVPQDSGQAAPTTPPQGENRETPSSAMYRTQGDRVVEFDPAKSVMVESPEDGNLLIQVFRSMLGSGDFDVEKFKEDSKIDRIEELATEEGTPVYRLVAIPRKGSDIWKWTQVGNQEVEWQQELWVEQSTMRPLKAVLLSKKESTSVILRNSKLNQPVDPQVFLLPVKGEPKKYRKDSPAVNTAPSQKEFQGPRLEEIPIEENN
jgi:outer membrane lipoprotein-sorting protein